MPSRSHPRLSHWTWRVTLCRMHASPSAASPHGPGALARPSRHCSASVLTPQAARAAGEAALQGAKPGQRQRFRIELGARTVADALMIAKQRALAMSDLPFPDTPRVDAYDKVRGKPLWRRRRPAWTTHAALPSQPFPRAHCHPRYQRRECAYQASGWCSPTRPWAP